MWVPFHSVAPEKDRMTPLIYIIVIILSIYHYAACRRPYLLICSSGSFGQLLLPPWWDTSDLQPSQTHGPGLCHPEGKWAQIEEARDNQNRARNFVDAVNAFSCVATWCQWCGGLRFKVTQHRFSNPPLGSDQLVYTLTLVSRHGFLQFSAFYVSFLKETKTPSCAPLKLQVQASSEEKVVGNKHGACMEGFLCSV